MTETEIIQKIQHINKKILELQIQKENLIKAVKKMREEKYSGKNIF